MSYVAWALAGAQIAFAAGEPEPNVLAQLCRPNKTIAFEDLAVDIPDKVPNRTYSAEAHALLPRVIRRAVDSDDPSSTRRFFLGYGEVLKRDGILSDSGTTIRLHGATVASQPVYEYLGYPARDYVAIHVSISDAPGGTRTDYWFKVPVAIASDRFTDWIAPVSEEGPEIRARYQGTKQATWWKLTHGIEMETYPVGPGAPLMRFKLQARGKVDAKDDFYPAIVTAIQKSSPKPGIGDDRYRFVPKTGAQIPKC